MIEKLKRRKEALSIVGKAPGQSLGRNGAGPSSLSDSKPSEWDTYIDGWFSIKLSQKKGRGEALLRRISRQQGSIKKSDINEIVWTRPAPENLGLVKCSPNIKNATMTVGGQYKRLKKTLRTSPRQQRPRMKEAEHPSRNLERRRVRAPVYTGSPSSKGEGLGSSRTIKKIEILLQRLFESKERS